jgi:hypothetical protein
MVALAAIGADQPGMGMTNRVLPAQGEERGATYTLIRLDGDASEKFQSFEGGFFAAFLNSIISRQLSNLAPKIPRAPRS